MADMNAVIIDEDQKLLAQGEKGELCLAGMQVTPGYWKDDEKNSKKFFKLI